MIFKEIKGTNKKYYVSNTGLVKSLQGKKERILKPNTDKDGYLRVVLSVNNVRKTKGIHRLVIETFLGDSIKQVNHKDGVKKNNHISNLEYCTAKENILHAETTGLRNSKGEKSSTSKLKNEDVLLIRQLKGKQSCLKIAKRFNVQHSAIIKIWNYKTWKHV